MLWLHHCQDTSWTAIIQFLIQLYVHVPVFDVAYNTIANPSLSLQSAGFQIIVQFLIWTSLFLVSYYKILVEASQLCTMMMEKSELSVYQLWSGLSVSRKIKCLLVMTSFYNVCTVFCWILSCLMWWSGFFGSSAVFSIAFVPSIIMHHDQIIVYL